MEIPAAIILVTVSLILLVVYIISYWTSYVPVRKDGVTTRRVDGNTKLPSFSIVIVTHDCDSLLERLVNRLVEQVYPKFEIVIVNNASSDNTVDVIKRASIDHPSRVRHTYLPQNKNGTLHMSMATTLGIRAARNEWIVLLKPTSLPKSELWLASIANAITNGAEMCIGYNDYFGYDNAKWVRTAISQRRKAQLLNYRAVLRGQCKPIECEGSNVVFSKDEFFRNGGYGAWLALRDCHETPYVTTFAAKRKTAFLTAAESQVETILPPIEELWQVERRYAQKSYKKLSVSTKLRRKHYVMITMLYLLSMVCMALGIGFMYCPSPWDNSISVIREIGASTEGYVVLEILPAIIILLFVIISLVHYLCKLHFRHRDYKRLYTPLCTNPSEIMSL